MLQVHTGFSRGVSKCFGWVEVVTLPYVSTQYIYMMRILHFCLFYFGFQLFCIYSFSIAHRKIIKPKETIMHIPSHFVYHRHHNYSEVWTQWGTIIRKTLKLNSLPVPFKILTCGTISPPPPSIYVIFGLCEFCVNAISCDFFTLIFLMGL
jgi:hypothetical protein